MSRDRTHEALKEVDLVGDVLKVIGMGSYAPGRENEAELQDRSGMNVRWEWRFDPALMNMPVRCLRPCSDWSALASSTACWVGFLSPW